jgi:Rrf2 family protein
MSNILKISEAASLATHSMVFLAANPEKPHSTREIADALLASEAHLSKVFQRLSRHGLVHSVRGPRGGFELAKPGDQIRLLEVYEAIEGRVVEIQCLLNAKVCNGSGCVFGSFLKSASREFRHYLESTTLSDLAHLCRRQENHAEEDHQDR